MIKVTTKLEAIRILRIPGSRVYVDIRHGSQWIMVMKNDLLTALIDTKFSEPNILDYDGGISHWDYDLDTKCLYCFNHCF